MKTVITILTFVFLFGVNGLFAQSWVSQTSGTTQNLNGAYFINESTGWIAGNNGTLLKTTNSGNNWVQYSTGSAVSDVYFIDAQKGFAVGSSGMFTKTTNGGLNWEQQNLGTSKSFTSIHFSGPLNGWIGGDGCVFHTTDGGNTWVSQGIPTNRWLNSIYFANTSTGWAVGVIGTIIATTNGGSTWTLQQSVDWDTHDVFFINAATGWLCTTTGKIHKTTNGGNNWVQQVESVAGFLYSIRFVNENTGWACGAGSNIAATTNGGATWFSQSLGGSGAYYDVFPVNSQTGYIIGNNGTILKTTNGGGAPVLPAPPSNLTATAVSSTQINLNWQDNSTNEQYFTLQRSPNGTSGWSQVSTPTSNATSFQNTGLNPNEEYHYRICASGWYGNSSYSNVVMVRTLLPTPTPLTPAFNAVNVSLTPEFSWTAVSGVVVYHLQVSANENFASFLYNDSVILGATSRTLPAGILQNSTQYFWRVRAKNLAVPSLYSGTMRFTTSAPSAPTAPNLVSPANNSIGSSLTPLMNWDSTVNASSFRVQISSDSLFATSNFDTTLGVTQVTVPAGKLTNNVKYFWRVMSSGPGGNSAWSTVWKFTTTMPAPAAPNLVSPANNSIGSSLTPLMNWDSTVNASSFRIQVSSDSLFATSNFDTTLSVTQVTVPAGKLTNNVKYFWRVMSSGPGGNSAWSAVWNFKPLLTGISGMNEIPAEFKLYNNYPNPFNPSTTIKYDLPENGFVKIRVFDITGQEVNTLVNEQKQAGRYEITFNAASLSSGVYFYRIEAGKFTEMKKMVLVK
jgi:photosystem II stability/assembly factor-like uncharacterized protein